MSDQVEKDALALQRAQAQDLDDATLLAEVRRRWGTVYVFLSGSNVPIPIDSELLRDAVAFEVDGR